MFFWDVGLVWTGHVLTPRPLLPCQSLGFSLVLPCTTAQLFSFSTAAFHLLLGFSFGFGIEGRVLVEIWAHLTGILLSLYLFGSLQLQRLSQSSEAAESSAAAFCGMLLSALGTRKFLRVKGGEYGVSMDACPFSLDYSFSHPICPCCFLIPQTFSLSNFSCFYTCPQ